MNLKIFLTLSFAFTVHVAAGQSIRFLKLTPKEGLEYGKKTFQPVLIYTYFDKGKASSFTEDSATAEGYNKHFANLYYPLDLQKPEDRQWAIDRKITRFPALLFYEGSSGNLLKKAEAVENDPAALEAIGQAAALDFQHQFKVGFLNNLNSESPILGYEYKKTSRGKTFQLIENQTLEVTQQQLGLIKNLVESAVEITQYTVRPIVNTSEIEWHYTKKGEPEPAFILHQKPRSASDRFDVFLIF